MENKYLEKIAGIGFTLPLIGAMGGVKASKKKENAVGRSVAGFAVGAALNHAGEKVVTHGVKNFGKMLLQGKARPAHAIALAAGTVGTMSAGIAGSYYGGKGAGKLYDKAKEKLNVK